MSERACDFCGKPAKEPFYLRCASCLERIGVFVEQARKEARAEGAAEEREACALTVEDCDVVESGRGYLRGDDGRATLRAAAAVVRARATACKTCADRGEVYGAKWHPCPDCAPKDLSKTQQKALAIQRGDPCTCESGHSTRPLGATRRHDPECPEYAPAAAIVELQKENQALRDANEQAQKALRNFTWCQDLECPCCSWDKEVISQATTALETKA